MFNVKSVSVRLFIKSSKSKNSQHAQMDINLNSIFRNKSKTIWFMYKNTSNYFVEKCYMQREI